MVLALTLVQIFYFIRVGHGVALEIAVVHVECVVVVAVFDIVDAAVIVIALIIIAF